MTAPEFAALKALVLAMYECEHGPEVCDARSCPACRAKRRLDKVTAAMTAATRERER